jgi:serine/threonine-protein kinase
MAPLVSAGDVIADKYRVVRKIGEGGMATVFLAEHLLLGRDVAVKVLSPKLASSMEVVVRFLNEARAAARIENDHVAKVLDVARLPGGAPYIVLELLEGTDLHDLLRERARISVEEAAGFVLQALEAIAQAHAMGIIHRDLKPSNLFLARRKDGTHRIKVLDFGISKANNPLAEGVNALTSTKSMLGTPMYMSPEQIRNARVVDARSDIWSLGVILHELVAGTTPFHGETLGELLVAIREESPPPLRTLRPEVPEAFERLVLQCLARKPEERFQHVAALATALAAFAPAAHSSPADRVRASLTSYANVASSAPSAVTLVPEDEKRSELDATVEERSPVAQTNHSWHATGSSRSPRPRAVLPVGIGVAIVMVVGVAAALRWSHARSPAAGVAPSAGVPSIATAPAPSASSAVAVTAAAASATTTPDATSVAPTSTASAPKPTARPAWSPVRPAQPSKTAVPAPPPAAYDPLKDPRSN